MNYLEPIYSHGMVFIPNVYNTRESVEKNGVEHANRLAKKLKDLNLYDAKAYLKDIAKEQFEHIEFFAEDGQFIS